MKKAKTPLITLGITLAIVLLITLICYLIVLKKERPLIVTKIKGTEYSIRVLNGDRYDGILFSTINCLDGTTKVVSRLGDAKCESDGIFKNGTYKNKYGVEISKEVYDATLTGTDIDDIEPDVYKSMKYFYENPEKNIRYCDLNKKSTEGYALLGARKNQSSEENEKTPCEELETYCWLGMGPMLNVFAPYVNGKCETPKNICDLLKDQETKLFHPELYYNQCFCQN